MQSNTLQLTNSETRYGAISKSVHWLTALFVASGWLIGKFAHFGSPKSPPNVWLLTHIALGQSVLALLVLRLLWRSVSGTPPFEATPLGKVAVYAARLTHVLLYGLLAAVPALGIVAELKRAGLLPVFGFWQLQSPWPVDRLAGRTVLGLHGYLADALLILAAVHALAALVHHFVWRDRTLQRMLPAPRQREPVAARQGAGATR